MTKENFLIKDSINPRVVKELSHNIKSNYKEFNEKKFSSTIIRKLKSLELKERVKLVTTSLYEYLPEKFETSVDILIKSLPDELPNASKGIDGYGENVLEGLHGFIMVSITNYISEYGLKHFSLSMKALNIMTRRFSAEEAARYFIKEHESRTLKIYSKWINDKNMHVRRLVSESTRPRLPWTMQLPRFVADPSPVLPFLEALKDDKELYVRRSVANNLNDISKDNPEIVIELLTRWNKDKSDQMQWLIKHALRTLLKEGNAKALALLGYKQNPKIDVSQLKLSAKKIAIGDSLSFELAIKSDTTKDQLLMIDYIVHHMKANGKLVPKVFKLKKVLLKAGEKLVIKKKHAIREISTRKYYTGKHIIELQINGSTYSKSNFNLQV